MKLKDPCDITVNEYVVLRLVNSLGSTSKERCGEELCWRNVVFDRVWGSLVKQDLLRQTVLGGKNSKCFFVPAEHIDIITNVRARLGINRL